MVRQVVDERVVCSVQREAVVEVPRNDADVEHQLVLVDAERKPDQAPNPGLELEADPLRLQRHDNFAVPDVLDYPEVRRPHHDVVVAEDEERDVRGEVR